MIFILFRAKVKPEMKKKLINFFEWDKFESEKERGTLRFEFYQDPEDENTLFVYEAYRDQKAFKEHQKHKPYKRWDSRIKFECEVKVLFNIDTEENR